MSGALQESDVPVEFRRVGVFSAAAWLVVPLLAGLILVGSLFGLLWLRADVRGRGDFTAFLILVAVVAVVVWLGRTLFQRFRDSRGNRLCLVVPPRAFLTARTGSGGGGFPGVMASAPLIVRGGRLMLRDRGREYPMVGAVDRVVVGVWRGRWCCYAEFARGEGTKRGQALGILPSVFRNGAAGIDR